MILVLVIGMLTPAALALWGQTPATGGVRAPILQRPTVAQDRAR